MNREVGWRQAEGETGRDESVGESRDIDGFKGDKEGVPCSGLFVATALRWDIISASLSGG